MQPQHTAVVRILRRAVSRALAGLTLTAVLSAAAPAWGAAIFLDPGHGGRYPGAVYAGVEEQLVNLLIAMETRTELIARGHSVRMSREGNYTVENGDRQTWHYDDATDRYTLYADGLTGVYSYKPGGSAIAYDDLQARSDMANAWGADVFISIHNNAGGTTANGTETFYNSWTTDTDAVLSRRLATFVQEDVVSSAGTYDRRVAGVGYYVIRWANMPAALVEVAFLSNATDRARLLNPTFRRRAAVGIANGIDRFLATDPFKPREPRIQGPDRYATAAAAARSAWPSGARTVIVASGQRWPDSLAAGPLSRALDAPLLLSPAAALAPATAEAIAELAPERIILLGGEAALESAVATAVAAAASIETTMVTRIAGTDRYETAALIASEVGTASGRAVVTSGQSYPDAVSISSYAAMSGTPVLLTRPSELSTATAGFLRSNPGAIRSSFVIGGTAAISDKTLGELRAIVPADRIHGPDRYATNLAVIKRFWPSGDIRPFVATASNFPDALVAGAVAGRARQPVMLCGARFLPGKTREWIMHDTARIRSFTMMGGTNALTYQLEWQLAKARRVPPR